MTDYSFIWNSQPSESWPKAPKTPKATTEAAKGAPPSATADVKLVSNKADTANLSTGHNASGTCPTCGRCPTCGNHRGYWPWRYWHDYQPIWYLDQPSQPTYYYSTPTTKAHPTTAGVQWA